MHKKSSMIYVSKEEKNINFTIHLGILFEFLRTKNETDVSSGIITS
jgi:hypothetical protein